MAETSQRARNPRGQGDRLRLEILEGAARLLSELGGEEGLTIRGVARAAGISPAAIYQHFADKSALVNGLIGYDYEQISRAMTKADESCPQDAVLERVRAQVRTYCQFVVDNPGHYRLLINHQPLTAPRSGPMIDLVTRVATAFERCQLAGVRLRLPARRAAVLVFTAAHGRVALWHASGDPVAAEALLDFVDEVVWLVTE
ncbi:TetR/AcrR family transcriptional regulator [Streptomyces sp. 35G-GA-8]|uniref:TetR/AcrR family transcriptional regulator n=1 Tax=Streptomyces sp. 35G-GA-8 TaxID=2939434 RepID=UPI00201F2E1B|nr:TetR/AcrR family transcriptional regulator [Streptomyces sp. 35G-GA-8]MCL7379820.1 TetR/AcrR family transcriptional regulator [Streptomyces sp. 35G-GA-8]